MTEASLARFAFIVGAMGALLAGCAQPNPDTAAGRSEIAGQKCTLCIVQNPGDYNACYAVYRMRLLNKLLPRSSSAQARLQTIRAWPSVGGASVIEWPSAMEMRMPARRAKPILVKRYARSRLYDATNQHHVSLEQLRDWAAKGVSFIVHDTETGADVTRVQLA
jgi:hypothetical protein